MKKHNMRYTSILMIIFSTIILIVTIFLGILINYQLRNKVKEMVYNNMADTSKTAAAFIDGEVFKDIDENTTKDSAEYQKIYNVLNTFKENNHFVYIYTCRMKDGKYFYVIDQDPVNPADYGEEIVYTEAMANAFLGLSSVDREATTDEWGSFYSTFSPIYDNSDHLVGVVGIDFDSAWYEEQLSRHNVYLLVLSSISLFAGVLIALLLMSQIIKRFRALNKGLSILSDDIDSLTKEISINHFDNVKETKESAEEGNEIEQINRKMMKMEYNIKKYVEYAHEQAFTDQMTGVSSKTAYYEYLKELEEKTKDHEISYKVIVFDLNGLKNINDNYGHECGDEFITNCAKVIMSLFGKDRTFRIGGDEFIVILEEENLDTDTIDQRIFDEMQEFNTKLKHGDIAVSFSFGASEFEKGTDDTFKKVFKRADEIMYQYKAKYYLNHGDRRKH